MKLLAFLCAVLLLITSSAAAEVVGRTAGGAYILRHLTDNTDEVIYYVSELPEIECEKEDYNGDGQTDLAVVTRLSSGNTGYQLFVMDQGRLVPVPHDGGEAALWNFDADEECVYSTYREGLFVTESLYLWEGVALHMNRRLTCEPLTAVTEAEGIRTVTTDLTRYRITVTSGNECLFDRTVSIDETEAVLAEAEYLMN